MEKRIKKADVIDAMKEGIQLIGVLALKAYGESLNQAGEQAFVEHRVGHRKHHCISVRCKC